MPHEVEYVVRPTQVDTFGHLNNAAFLELFEWARWEWARDAGMDLQPLMAEQRIGPVILHLDLSFRREILMHERVTIRTWFDAIKGFKGIVRQDMIKEDGRHGSSLIVTFVMFHLDKRRVVKVPDEMQGAFERDEAYRQELTADS